MITLGQPPSDRIQRGTIGAKITSAGMELTGGGLDLFNTSGNLSIKGANALVLYGGGNAAATITSTIFQVDASGGLKISNIGAFAASDKYLIVDATGNVHKSALGPAS